MNEEQALNCMVPPSQYREVSVPYGGIIQIHITRACDKACFNCTQGSNLRGNTSFISLDQFEKACESLSDYWGLVPMFGGSPCLHPQFPELCDIMARHIHKDHRGLWANKLFGHGKKCREMFRGDRTNLNVHMDQEAYDEIKRDWPEANVFGLERDSRHSPPFVAMKDIIPDEGIRWELISTCDINRKWSAMVCVFRGELRGYFCEVAGSQAMLHQEEPDYPDLGVPIEPGWWKRPMEDFKEQVKFHCHACGMPLRAKGSLAQQEGGIEYVSESHLNIHKLKKPERLVQIITSIDQLGLRLGDTTKYLENAR